jgi:hypothetical protein
LAKTIYGEKKAARAMRNPVIFKLLLRKSSLNEAKMLKLATTIYGEKKAARAMRYPMIRARLARELSKCACMCVCVSVCLCVCVCASLVTDTGMKE